MRLLLKFLNGDERISHMRELVDSNGKRLFQRVMKVANRYGIPTEMFFSGVKKDTAVYLEIAQKKNAAVYKLTKRRRNVRK